MSLLVVEQTQTLFLGGKTLWRQREESCQAHLTLGWFIHTALLTHHFLHFLLCPAPNPSHTNTYVHLSLQPYLPFPTRHHGWLSLGTGSNPAHGWEADRRDKPLSTLLPCCTTPKSQPTPSTTSHLHPHLCPHPSSKLHQAHWQGRTVADSCAATADHALQQQLWSDMGRESNAAAGAKAGGMHPPSPSLLHRTRRVQLVMH